MGAFQLVAEPAAEAQALKPNILIIFDTSGSMSDNNQFNTLARTDGSEICKDSNGNILGTDRRIYLMKKALRDTLTQVGTDEANLGLARFPQLERPNDPVACPRGHYFNNSTTNLGCRLSTQGSNQTTYGTWFDNAFRQAIVVDVTRRPAGLKPVAADFDPPDGNIATIYRWLDLKETVAGGQITDPEIRSGGAGIGNDPESGWRTPLGRSLFYARLYFDNFIKPSDPKVACRKNIVILVSDGFEFCDPDSEDAFYPPTQARLLRTISGVVTYVLTDSALVAGNNPIAVQGGTGAAIGVDLLDSSAIQAALVKIIAESVPPIEICNGVDDNCNNLIDEPPLPGVGGQCSCAGLLPENIGKGMCRAGALVCRGAAGIVCEGCVAPGTEICNGLDDNCNGQVDEGFDLGAICTNGGMGACTRAGNLVCAPNGMGTVCDAPTVQGSQEICNNVDDDCDGMVDENAPEPLPGVGETCGVNLGQCKAGTFRCELGRLVCDQTTSMGMPEICNGLDDNCNGQTDEGFPIEECACPPHSIETLKTGSCKPGRRVCKGALGFVCEGCVPPRMEVCNGLDDDCDGMGDTGDNLCTPGRICVEEDCQLLCGDGEFPCPIGYECQSKVHPTQGPVRICVSTKCRNVSCMPGFNCNQANGLCEDPCAGVMCNDPQKCFDGLCKDCRTKPDLCAPGDLCREGRCVPNPCASVVCQSGQYCDNGQCLTLCNGTCAAGQRCLRGACVADACGAVSCQDGEVCDPNTGLCTPNRCLLIACPGQRCVPLTGTCVDNPCLGVTCPADQCLLCGLTVDGAPECRVDLECRNDRDSTTVDRIIRTGGAGCSCTIPGERSGTNPQGLALLALAAIAAVRVRRRIRR
jgi:MYXO-CTERM domain-containing protein